MLGRNAPVAAPQRQSLGCGAAKAAQRVGLVHLGEAAHGQRFGCRRGLAGFVDVVGGGWFEAAAAILLDGQVIGIGLADLAAQLDGAEEMRVEQRVELVMALGRRREQRMRGAADVVQAARTQQRDGGQERRRLLRRDREAVGAQQAGEGDERLRSKREGHAVHAATPVMMASSRGAI